MGRGAGLSFPAGSVWVAIWVLLAGSPVAAQDDGKAPRDPYGGQPQDPKPPPPPPPPGQPGDNPAPQPPPEPLPGDPYAPAPSDPGQPPVNPPSGDPRTPTPNVELQTRPSGDFRDLYGALGWVIYQRRSAFRDRDGALMLSAHSHGLRSEFLYTAYDAALGVSGDSNDQENSGFRFRLGGRLGIGYSYRSGFVGLGVGISFNGETEAIPAALTAPIEFRTTNWLSPTMRMTGWARGDRLLAAYDSREQAADRYGQLDELSFGLKVLFVSGKGRASLGIGDQQRRALKGLGVGITYHRTMGSGLYTISLIGGATTIPRHR